MNKIKVAIVDDVNLFANGLKLIIENDADIEVTLLAAHGKELLDALHHNPKIADFILLDLEMPVMDGVDTIRQIVFNKLPVKVIIISSHFNDGIILKLLEEGAVGFLAKNENPEIVIHTLKEINKKGYHFDKYILHLIQNRKYLSSPKIIDQNLTGREIEIIKLICLEKTNKEIAASLYISSRTVEGHRQNILSKTGCKNSVGLVIYAIKHKIIDVNSLKFI